MTTALGYMWDGICSATELLRGMLRGERAQPLAEYSLLLTLVGVGVVVPSMLLFRGALAGAFSVATDCILRTTC